MCRLSEMNKKVKVGRCPWCLRRDVESILIKEGRIYRCPNCCFIGKEKDVLEEYTQTK